MFDKISKLSESPEISSKTFSSDNSMHPFEEDLELDSPRCRDEDEMTTRALDSGQEYWLQAVHNGDWSGMLQVYGLKVSLLKMNSY